MVGAFRIPPTLDFQILDLPRLHDCDECCPGFWVAVATASTLDRFDGAQIFWSRDNVEFVSLGTVTAEAMVGQSQTVLAATSPCYRGYWDRQNTVDVRMSGSRVPATVTEDDILVDGKNFAMLGAEIIAFRDATQIDDLTYRLSHLLRGRRDTDPTTTHLQFEPFALLDETIVPFSASLKDVGATRYFKAVPPGGVVADFDSFATVLSGSRLRPFAPVNVKGTRDGSDNLTITWTPRSYARARLLAPALPHSCCCEEDRYILDLYDPALPSTIVRTAEVESVTSYEYTAAQQTADGLTPGDPVGVNVHRASKALQRGNFYQSQV